MKNILIVGGSYGIGQSLIQMLLDQGYHCINFSRTVPRLAHSNLTHHTIDVTQVESWPELESISSIVYCPGSINLKPIGSLKIADFQSDFEINVLGAIKVIKAYLRNLKKQEDPSIVLFSTVAVYQGMPFHSSVAVSKGGVEALSKSLAAELAPKVRVNCIAPSITDTPLAAQILRSDKSRENISQKHPLKKIINPEDVAHLAAFLISPAASAITGQTLAVDAGMSTLKV